MARKQPELLASDPVSRAYAAWQKAEREVLEADKKVEAMWSDKTATNLRKGVTIEEFKAAVRRVDIKIRAAFGMLDRWIYLRDHKDDKVNVPEAEVRAMVLESLSDKLDGLTFSTNSGLLGSKIAQAIFKHTTEASSGVIPYCQDCQ